jgi:ubiquinone/menaquinone biosynthesis C-methylase UbiE
MANSSSTTRLNPLSIFDALTAYQLTMAMKGAIELEIFTHIDDGGTEPAEIARRSRASERGIRVLCDYLSSRGFLTKTNGTYGLTGESAAFLSKRSSTYIGSIADFLAHDCNMSHFRDIAAVVRKGGAVEGGNMKPDDPIWVDFARDMAPFTRLSAEVLASIVAEPGKPLKVLDVAAGSGIWGIAVARLNPAAEIYAIDREYILRVARENAARFHVADRYRSIPGSVFEVDLGDAYDLVLLPNFLHHFDPPTNIQLLKRIHRAMKPLGILATVESLPNEDRISPPRSAAFSLVMLATTASGDAYTFRELSFMLQEAGFAESRLELPAEMLQPIVLSRA